MSALQGVEAAMRHLNMRRAAEELNVTASAISHNVRSVEDGLGKRLFDRVGKRLVPTPEGRILAAAIRRALDEIGGAGLRIIEGSFSGSLSVVAPPSFTAQWLIPRLPRFLVLFPDLDVRLGTIPPLHDGPLPGVDVAIVFNRDSFPDRHVETLVRLRMFPVCAPELVKDPLPLSPETIADATLIHEDDGAIWARWFASAGLVQSKSRRAVHVGSSQSALALARAGVGFAMDDDFMGSFGTDAVVPDAGLIRPFGQRSFEFGHYALISPPVEQRSAVVSAFTGWIKSERALGHRQ